MYHWAAPRVSTAIWTQLVHSRMERPVFFPLVLLEWATSLVLDRGELLYEAAGILGQVKSQRRTLPARHHQVLSLKVQDRKPTVEKAALMWVLRHSPGHVGLSKSYNQVREKQNCQRRHHIHMQIGVKTWLRVGYRQEYGLIIQSCPDGSDGPKKVVDRLVPNG